MKEKSFEKKAELLAAALDEFIEKNYEEASLNNIIKNAGISKGTFYYHFADKQALYLFLLESSAKTKWEFICARTKAPEYPESYEQKDIFEKFKLQARIGAEFAAAFPKYHRLSKMFVKERGNPIYETAKAALGNDTEEFLEEMIAEAIESGEFKEGFSSAFIKKTIRYLFVHFDEIFHAQEDLELDNMLQNLDDFSDFLKNGLGS